MDVNDAASYRPISNLFFLSKIVEKVVEARLTEHVEGHRLLPTFQSAYRPFHSTETGYKVTYTHQTILFIYQVRTEPLSG